MRIEKSLKEDMHRPIESFDDFKIVMDVIAEIKSSTITTELRIKKMQETFTMLEDHKIKV